MSQIGISSVRRTARLLLIDDAQRILLMRIDDPRVKETRAAGGRLWVTLGGRLEEGETVLQAAAREALEETGQSGIEVGPEVWYGEQILTIGDEPVLLKETFVVARTRTDQWNDSGWTHEESSVIQEMRWWTGEELANAVDPVLPRVMIDLLPNIMKGVYPPSLVTIEL